MGNRAIPFVVGEWYHCYSRGIDKCTTFLEDGDYQRFLENLHIANRINKIPRNALRAMTTNDIWQIPTDEPLVAIGAYCLMPNHFHLIIKEIVDGGISIFMQRIGTAYAMFFNKKYSRSGALFTSPFRSRHISNEQYLQQVIEYVHLNPLGLLSDKEPKKEKIYLRNYPYSSLLDHANNERLERCLINFSQLPFKVEPWARFHLE